MLLEIGLVKRKKNKEKTNKQRKNKKTKTKTKTKTKQNKSTQKTQNCIKSGLSQFQFLQQKI